jgi:hypothetical protein
MCALTNAASLADCPGVQDEDKRSFEDLRPILIDVDNDGKPDSIVPRVYSLRVNRRRRGRRTAKEIHWITFDLKTSKGRVLKSFFRYRYGDNLADYWVFALVPCKRSNGRVDLLFYSGDDTSDEIVILRYEAGRFVVRSRKKSNSQI